MASHMPQEFIGAATIESLPEPDTLSSYEFWRQRQRSSLPQPELTLMMAILEDALKCYFDYAQAKTRPESKLFDEAEQWFFSQDDEELFSFKSVCAFLGIDPDYVRQGLLLFKKVSSRRGARRNKILSKPRGSVVDSNTIKNFSQFAAQALKISKACHQIA